MDCDLCGRHRPSEQVVPTRSARGTVLMLCGPCRRHAARRSAGPAETRTLPGDARHSEVPAA